MKTRLFASALVLSCASVFADSIQFTEKWVDTIYADSDYGCLYHDYYSVNSATINATFTVPGLGGITEDSLFQFSLGGFSFPATRLGDADIPMPTSAIFIQTDFDGKEIGRITLSRSGNTLTLSGNAKQLEADITASFYTDEPGPIVGDVPFSIGLGDWHTNRTLYFKGNNTITHRVTLDCDGFEEEFDLNNIQISGLADYTKPTLTITSPAATARLTNGVVTVKTRATDNIGVADVLFKLNDGNFESAQNWDGTNVWVSQFELVPGTNIIQARSLDYDGNASATAVIRPVFVVLSPLTLVTNGNGKVVGATNGQLLEVGRRYTLTATPFPTPANLFSNWTGDVFTNSPKLNFFMQSNLLVEANFIANRFLPIKGVYNGLFYDTNGVHHENSGFATFTLADKGAFSGRLLTAGKSLPLTGQFNLNGGATSLAKRGGTNPPLAVQLHLDLETGTEQITGSVSVSNDTWVAWLQADRAVFDAKTNPASFAGKYTMVMPGSDDAASSPGGDGFGTVTVATNGAIRFSGTLADGTATSQATTLSKFGQWPFYLSLYAGKGSMLSRLQFDFTQAASDLAGELSWIKTNTPTARYYRGGYTNVVGAVGSLYWPPPGTTNRAVMITNGLVEFGGGNLPAPFTNRVLLTESNKVINLTNSASTNKLTLTIVKPSGLFNGTVVIPGTTRSLSFKGALLQKPAFGSGFFLGTNQSGHVQFEESP